MRRVAKDQWAVVSDQWSAKTAGVVLITSHWPLNFHLLL